MGNESKSIWKVEEVHRQVSSLWKLRGPLKVTQWGDRFLLFEFESVGKANWVYNFG